MTILLAYPLVAGITLNAQKIISIVYGTEFISAAVPMIILSLTLLITFPGAVIMNAIFSFNRQKEMVPMWIVGTILNALLNLYLIPIMGIVGAAITSLISQLVVVGVFWYKMRKISHFTILKRTFSIVKATLLMIVAILAGNLLNLPFILLVPLSILVYLSALILFKDATLADITNTVRNSHDVQSPQA